jgi:trafficking protein particle complex subunit 11
LTPTSPLYPDGIITPLWITKHQSRLPAVFVTFFALTADPNTSSLNDNQIKIEIGNIRGVFSSTNYKTKVVVILVGESTTGAPLDLEERLGSIRRATGLDSRHLFFYAPEPSKEAANEFVRSILASLQPFCVEYYRDLSKHTRRKRNRTSVPPPTIPPTYGTSQTLPLQGWNVRYEFKLGVFAEFRQEMDAACRNYESAYEGLFSHELFETISNWSPRFNETRLLADAVAIRIIRCLLWTAQRTSAARFWNKHRGRIRELVNRKGKGLENYGWEAWETVWSKSFAQALVRFTGLEIAASGLPETEQIRPQFFPPEKSIPIGERIAPWELLHHNGYWWNRAWKHTRKRRQLAHQMPEEDRTSPGQSPASAIANRSHLYDNYLALEPHLEYPLDGKGYDYSLEILNAIQSATRSFSQCHQDRFVEQLRLEEAKEHLRQERWHDALGTIRTIWPCLSWRRAGWWKMVVEAAWIFRKAARQTGDAESLLRLEWETRSSAIPLSLEWKYALHRCLDDVDTSKATPSVVMKSEDSLSPVWASLNFATADGNVGEPLKAQLVLVSTAHRQSEAIHLSEVKIVFEGGLRTVRLMSKDSETSAQAQSIIISDLRLRESSSSTRGSTLLSPTSGHGSLVGMADIVIQPGQRKVFDMTCIPREAGDVKVASISLLCESHAFSLTYVINQYFITNARWWSCHGAQPNSRQLRRDGDPSTVRILSKPPKVRIELPNLKQMYYTNENIYLAVVIQNEESQTADVAIKARLLSPSRHDAGIRWDDMTESDSFDSQSKEKDVPSKEFLSLPYRSVGSITGGGSHRVTFVMDGDVDGMQHELELTARYHLIDDPETLLSKDITVGLPVSRPFEANYDFLPRLDSTSWPSFFDPLTTATGLSQRFSLVTKIACFVSEPVIIEDVSVSTQSIFGNAICNISNEETLNVNHTSWHANEDDATIPPEGLRESSFDLLVRKNALGDAHSVGLDLALVVQWRRSLEEDLVISTLDIPRYVIPMSEPRVLLSKRLEATKNQPGLMHVQYTIENPSMHYLTFNLTMESSDEFAFSGPKSASFSLVPISRHTVDYRILARQGARWIRVSLGVLDAYYSKALRVSPASEGVKSDGKRGLLVWVD